MKKEIIEWTKTIVVSIIIGLIIIFFVMPLHVNSVSMTPTLMENDFLIALKDTHVRKGDIISFQSEIKLTEYELSEMGFFYRFRAGEYKNLIKRVIAVEGDKLIIKDNKVFVNDQEQKEDYIKEYGTWGNITIEKIPNGKVFVMGDNRNSSVDSRSKDVGLIDVESIQGKVILRLYPFNKIGTVK